MPGHRDGLVDIPGATGIDHQRGVGTDRFARRRDFGDADLMKLDEGVAALDRLGAILPDDIGVAVAQQARIGRHALHLLRSAEQTVERLAGALSGNIPQRNVERRECKTDRAVARAIALLVGDIRHQRRDVGRIAPDRQRRNGPFHRHLGNAASRQAKALAPTDDALVRRDFDEQRFHPRPLRRGGILRRIAEVIGNADVEGFDGCDFHWR